MRTAFRVLVGLIALEVIVQGMAIAYGLAGFGKWIDDGNTATKALFEEDGGSFGGEAGFAIHFINGTMILGILLILTLIVSFFAKTAGATRTALILFGLVILQVALGLTAHSVPGVVVLHVLNAFAIFSFAAMSFVRLGKLPADATAPAQASVAV
jgi:heme A synthase